MSKLIVELFLVIAVLLVVLLISADAKALEDMKGGYVCTTQEESNNEVYKAYINGFRAGYTYGTEEAINEILDFIQRECSTPGIEIELTNGVTIICK